MGDDSLKRKGGVRRQMASRLPVQPLRKYRAGPYRHYHDYFAATVLSQLPYRCAQVAPVANPSSTKNNDFYTHNAGGGRSSDKFVPPLESSAVSLAVDRFNRPRLRM